MLEQSKINIVLAVDHAFCMPLSVAIRSVLRHLKENSSVTVWILHHRVPEAAITRVNDSLADLLKASKIHWLPISADMLSDATVDGHVSIVTYFRILIGRYLPSDVQRVIYLDCDVLVRKDISRLFSCDLEGKTVGAVQDSASPFLDAKKVHIIKHAAIRNLAATRPIPNYQHQNLLATAPYFNAGILLIDLKRWREQQVEESLLQCIRQHQSEMIWWDQYALNVVLYNDWRILEPTWNVTSHLMSLPTAKQCYLDESTFNELRRDPSIVHFSSDVKPWHALCKNPFRSEFDKILDETRWAGTKPSRQQWRREVLHKVTTTTRRILGKCLSKFNPWHRPLPHQI
jgi:lipopolysaccharide biosynthesis glycosyltransferase